MAGKRIYELDCSEDDAFTMSLLSLSCLNWHWGDT